MENEFYKFAGTHKEIGEQVGELYNSWGRSGVRIPNNADDFFASQLNIYQKYFPQYLDYVEGLAVALGVEKEKALKSLLTIYLSDLKPESNKCSIFAVNNVNGVFVGRNYDWREASEPYSSVFRFDIKDGSSNSFYAISDMAIMIGPDEKVDRSRCVFITEDVWNDSGLYIGLSGAPYFKKVSGMSAPLIIQCAIENRKATEEAVTLISKIPCTESKIFTIADKQGNLAVIEKHVEFGSKVRTSTKTMISTNHYLHEDLLVENASIFRNVPFHSTFARYSYLDIRLRKEFENVDFKKAFEIMSVAPVTQNWRGRESGDVVTTWRLALNLNNGDARIVFSPLTESKVEFDQVKLRADKG